MRRGRRPAPNREPCDAAVSETRAEQSAEGQGGDPRQTETVGWRRAPHSAPLAVFRWGTIFTVRQAVYGWPPRWAVARITSG